MINDDLQSIITKSLKISMNPFVYEFSNKPLNSVLLRIDVQTVLFYIKHLLVWHHQL